MHMGVAFLVLLAIGALLHPDYNGNPLTWLIAGAIILGAIGLVYGWWLNIRSQQAMIDTERNTRK